MSKKTAALRASTAAAAATPPATTEEAAAPAAPVDRFADLPIVSAADFEIRDLTSVKDISPPLKYEGVQKTATEKGLHMKSGWKFRDTVFKLGTNKVEKKPGTVMGDIQQVVKGYGAKGCPAPVLVSRLRQMQIGNKRSHYCIALPPVGWAEGYVQGAINDGLIKDGGKIEHGLDVVEAPAEDATETGTPAPAAASNG